MKNILMTVWFICLCSVNVFSQKDYQFHTKSKSAVKYFQRAVYFYDSKRNAEAEGELRSALREDENFLEAQMMLGDVYSDLRQFDKAIIHYRKAIGIDPSFFPQNFFNLAKAEMQINEFDSAKVHLEAFLTFKSKTSDLREKAEKLLRTCNFAAYAVKHPVPFVPVNLGDSINSADDEYLPALTADELTIVYTRRRLMSQQGARKDYNEDFYISRKDNGRWQLSKNLGSPVNTLGNEGAHCLSPDGLFVYFTACNRDGYRGCDLYFSRRNGNQWSAPQNMGPVVNSEQWDSQPAISSDGNTIYFLSSRPGGYGKQDIWKTIRNENGKWSEPENLGPVINTPESEMSPFIHPDNQTLYFASEGHPGMGGTDLFYSRLGSDGKWQLPVNLGYPINSSGDESSLFVNASGTMAYFASDRLSDTRGRLDIYSFELYPEARPRSVSFVKGFVKDKSTKAPLEASFQVMDVATGSVIAASVSDKATGEFLVCLPAGNEYALNVSCDGYLFYSDNFNCKNAAAKQEPFLLEVMMSKARAGEKIILKNIFFETNAFELKPESFAELNKAISFMKQNPGVSMEISGHTDNVGDDRSNQLLSEKRARSVFDFLVRGGINASRLSYKGYGETRPVAGNDSETGRSQNRRTEFLVTSVK